MFEAWRSAWQEAVDNFRRELDPDSEEGAPFADAQVTSMRRDLRAAERELERVLGEVRRAQEDHRAETEASARCRRQERMARGIGDERTAELAAHHAVRHARRARVFDQKLRAAEAEAELHRDDVAAMRARLERVTRSHPDRPAPNTAPGESDDPAAAPNTAVPDASGTDSTAEAFRRLEQNAREDAADRRIQELKRRMS